MAYNPYITLVRKDRKGQSRVSVLTLSKTMDKIRSNVNMDEFEALRTDIKYGNKYLVNRTSSMHRLYPSAKLKKGDDGQLSPLEYRDMLLLSAGPVVEEGDVDKLKQLCGILPVTAAAFMGASGRTLKILARVTLPTGSRLENPAEMDHFFRKAYSVAAALYGSLLNVPVMPSGITDGSSPVMATCRISADSSPLINTEAVALKINGSEPFVSQVSKELDIKAEDNEVTVLARFLDGHYRFRYNTVRGATEYLDKRMAYWGWRACDMRFVNSLSLDARESGIDARPKDVLTYLNSLRIQSIDPVDSYLYATAAQWDGHDYIADVAARVKTDLPQWTQWFRLWFLGMVAQWMGYNGRYGNSIVPLLVAPQGWHKSTFCRMLLPPELKWGYLDNLKFDNQKTVMQSMTEFLLINIDEFNTISKKTQEGFLKNTLQLATIAMKRPYARRVEQEKRMASFIATSNMTDILSDPSGSRRFFVVNVSKPIDTETPINYVQLYAQAVEAVRNNERRWFDDADIEAVMAHNRRYSLLSSADIYFNEYFVVTTKDDPDALCLTAASIFDYIRRRAGAGVITESLTNFSRYLSNVPGIEKTHSRTGNIYYVKYSS